MLAIILVVLILVIYIIYLDKNEKMKVCVKPDNKDWEEPAEYNGKPCNDYYQNDDRGFLIVNPWMLPHSAKSCPEDYQLRSPCTPDHDIMTV